MAWWWPFGVPHAPKVVSVEACRILRGTYLDTAHAYIALMISILACVYGIIRDYADNADKGLCFFLVFLVSMHSLSLATALRDEHLWIIFSPDVPAAVTALLSRPFRGSSVYYFQVWITFGATCVFFWYTMSIGKDEWTGDRGFRLLSAFFCSVASLSAAQAYIDSQDAAALSDMSDQGTMAKKLVKICGGLKISSIFAVLGCFISVVVTLAAAWTIESSANAGLSGFYMLLIGMLFCSYTAVLISKLSREEMNGQCRHAARIAYKVAYGFYAFVTVVAFYIVGELSNNAAQDDFLRLGLLFAISSLLSVAKLVRDTKDIQDLRALVLKSA